MTWRNHNRRWDPSAQEQMKNTEKAYSKNKRIASVLNYELYGPKGIETTKRLVLDELDDQRAMLEFDLNRMSREAEKNALLAEQINAEASGNTMVSDNLENDVDTEHLFEDAQFEIMEDEREKAKKNKLLGDFGKNFYGYVSRPGDNSSSLSEKKIKKEYSKINQYYQQSNIKRTNPRIKKLLQNEKLKQSDVLQNDIKVFISRKNPTFDSFLGQDALTRVLQRHQVKQSQSDETDNQSELLFGRPKAWRPSSGRQASRKTALDHFNIIHILPTKLTEQTLGQGVGHKDQRGVFVTENNKSQLISDLGLFSSDLASNEQARKGSIWDFGPVEDTFAPDGQIRTALTMPKGSIDMDDIRKARYVKADQLRFYDVEIRPTEIFNKSQTASQLF